MEKTHVTNNHFKFILNETKKFLDRNEEPPEDLFKLYIEELKYSNLIVPGIPFEDNTFDCASITYEDGKSFIPLYTGDSEYI